MSTVNYSFIGKVARVVDGDTYDILIDLGFGIYHKIRVRLRGVDTPEVYGKQASAEGRAASEYVTALLDDKTVWLRTYKNAPSTFNRWEADIRCFLKDTDEASVDLAEHLVETGHAVRVAIP